MLQSFANTTENHFSSAQFKHQFIINDVESTELDELIEESITSKEKRKLVCLALQEALEKEIIDYKKLLYSLPQIVIIGIGRKQVKLIVKKLTNSEEVKKSGLLVHHYLAVYKSLRYSSYKYASSLIKALERAAAISFDNLTGINKDTKIAVACDVSGSMMMPQSIRAKISFAETGLALAHLFSRKLKNYQISIYGDTLKEIRSNKSRGILEETANYQKIVGAAGYANNAYLTIKRLLDNKINMDKIFIFTDSNLWHSNPGGFSLPLMWTRYKALYDSKLYVINMAASKTMTFNKINPDVYLVSGWSDKIFDKLENADRRILTKNTKRTAQLYELPMSDFN